MMGNGDEEDKLENGNHIPSPSPFLSSTTSRLDSSILTTLDSHIQFEPLVQGRMITSVKHLQESPSNTKIVSRIIFITLFSSLSNQCERRMIAWSSTIIEHKIVKLSERSLHQPHYHQG
ncbi:hypothetical protein SSS_07210 [Sarcoptes scabiei]|uniref:Uncharacterized protein n=1 Tax=Sarcoptes scabiei TaxID=52283 RepID=A0A834VCV0_SARSC|nr:hypothetical protein SSS_07210 [Sarcoptes scabiei]